MLEHHAVPDLIRGGKYEGCQLQWLSTEQLNETWRQLSSIERRMAADIRRRRQWLQLHRATTRSSWAV